jgi:hypothetical protein
MEEMGHRPQGTKGLITGERAVITDQLLTHLSGLLSPKMASLSHFGTDG